MVAYFAALDPMTLVRALPGNVAQGLIWGIMGKANQSIGIGQKGLVASLRFVSAQDSYLFFIRLIVICLALVAVVYWIFGTEIGSAIRATGCNEQMARAQGINTNFTKVIALMISNGLVGLCGGIYAQYQGSADVNSGRGAIVIGLAAVMPSDYMKLFSAIVVAVFLAIPYLKEKYSTKRRRA